MPITDIKIFSEKYYSKGMSAQDIAKAENVTPTEAQEAKDFLLQNSGFKMEALQAMWTQLQYTKTHPYVPGKSNAPASPWSLGGDQTIGTTAKKDFWAQMDSVVEAAVRKVLKP